MNEQTIFTAAIERDPAQRSAFLDETCGADKNLRERVEKLIGLHAHAGNFLERPAAGGRPTVDQPVLEKPGMQIGPYKLREQIGEGGMGTVFMAEQTQPLQRQVALKVIKPGMDSRQVIARFDAERQALAMMDHVNIARVLDAGVTETGWPYFVMELIHGAPITKYCDDNHLTPRERLELFVPVCQAIQHAHQKGIIHRDIKPSNVMITLYDGRPIPKVIDFGVARATEQKLTERTQFTQSGTVVGTLEYMSPEQAEMNALGVDTRSDIYSLGVLLYELLTGSTPLSDKRFREAAYGEMLRMIKEDEPPKPSTRLSESGEALASISAQRQMEPAKLTNSMRGELDWIVMKTLEKDRNRRYETASGFAADVQRYLADEPVLACPPSAWYQLRKFARRNKGALTAACLVAAALTIGSAVSTMLAIRAARAERLAQERLASETNARGEAVAAQQEAEIARDREKTLRQETQQQKLRAELALAEVAQQKQRAEENFAKARRAVDEYLMQVTENELLTVPGLQPLREDLLEAALQFYQELTRERADDPSLQSDMAAAQYRLAFIQRERGKVDAFQATIAEAIRGYEALRQGSPESRDVQLGLARAYSAAGRYDEAVTICRQILATDVGHEETSQLLADTYNAIVLDQKQILQPEQILEYHQHALGLRLALVGKHPDNPSYIAELGRTIHNIGVLLHGQGRLREALAMYQRSASYLEQACVASPQSLWWGTRLAIGLHNIAACEAALEMRDKAVPSYRRHVALRQKLASENSAVISLRGDLYQALVEQGRYLKQIGENAEANLALRAAREVLENIPRETPEQMVSAAGVYASLGAQAGNVDAPPEDAQEAERFTQLAMQALHRAVDTGFRNSQALQTEKLLESLRKRPDFQELARQVERRAKDETETQRLRKRVEQQPQDSALEQTLADTLHSIGLVKLGQKQFAEAENNLSEALQQRLAFLKQRPNDAAGRSRSQDRLDAIASRVALGQVWWKTGRLPEAHRAWQTCMQELARISDSELQRGVADLERDICASYAEMGLWPFAVEYASRNARLQRYNPLLWPDHYFAILMAVTGALDDLEKYQQAMLPLYRKRAQEDKETLVIFPWVNVLLGKSRFDPSNSLALAEAAVEHDSFSWKHYTLALVKYRLEKPAESLGSVEGMGNLSSKYASVLVRHALGDSAEEEQWWKLAETSHRQVVEDSLLAASPALRLKAATGGDNLWWELAYAQRLRREVQETLRPAELSNDPWQHLIQARGYRLIDEIEKAEGELVAAVAVTPVEPAVWRTRAKFFERFRETERAELDWQQSVAVSESNPLPWLERGLWYAISGQHAQADADFAKATALLANEAAFPNNVDTLIKVDGELTSAINWRLDMLRLTPTAVVPRINLASGLNNLSVRLRAGADPRAPVVGQIRQLNNMAVELAKEAADSDLKADHWAVLGVAHYRAANWAEAIAVLQTSRRLSAGAEDGLTSFCLAMAHWQLDEKDEARKWYHQAVEWMKKNKPDDEELRCFRAEAAELLGVEEKEVAQALPPDDC